MIKKKKNGFATHSDTRHNPRKLYPTSWPLWEQFAVGLSEITQSAPLITQNKSHRLRWTPEGERLIPYVSKKDATPDTLAEGWFTWFGGYDQYESPEGKTQSGSPIATHNKQGKRIKSAMNDASPFSGTPAEKIFDSLPDWHHEGERRGIPSKTDVCKTCGEPYASPFWIVDRWELNICSKCSPGQQSRWVTTDFRTKVTMEKGQPIGQMDAEGRPTVEPSIIPYSYTETERKKLEEERGDRRVTTSGIFTKKGKKGK